MHLYIPYFTTSYRSSELDTQFAILLGTKNLKLEIEGSQRFHWFCLNFEMRVVMSNRLTSFAFVVEEYKDIAKSFTMPLS